MTSESTEDLLRQYVQDALIAKSSGSGTKLYDQCVLVSEYSGFHFSWVRGADSIGETSV